MVYITDDVQFDLMPSPLKAKIKWLMILRVLLISVLLGSISIIQIKSEKSFLIPFFALIAITYLLTILYSVLYRYLNNLVVFTYIQLIGDILLEICLIYFTGGIESPFSFTLTITIITASIILSRRGSLIIASISSILYGLLLDLQYFGTLSFPSSYIPMSKVLNSAYVFHTIFVNICAFYLISLLSGYLSESRKKANQELLAREEDLMELKAFNEDILKNMHSGLVVTDLHGRVTQFNKTSIDILDIKDLNTRTWFWKDIFSSIDFNEIINCLEEKPDKILKFNNFFDCKDKGNCFLCLRISLLQDSKGQAKRVIACFQDLTEFRKMEEKIRQHELLASIGSMAAGIAHELRNPLASIKGSIQLLTEGLKLKKDQKNLLEIILRESSHLNEIIDDFLLYARPAPPNLEKCDLNNIIHDTLVILKNAENFNKDIEIITELESENQYLYLDMNQIKQVFFNMLINACQAMPEGGTLNVRSFTKINEKRSYKIIEFQDTGIGISRKGFSKLFHPFYTTKENGTGLGLSIAYKIIEAHGGKIEADPHLEKGSLFRISLPT